MEETGFTGLIQTEITEVSILWGFLWFKHINPHAINDVILLRSDLVPILYGFPIAYWEH